MENWTVRQLYGGAITIKIPERFIDVSDFRQVPDHQEVFTDEKTDQSFIVEILGLENIENQNAIAYFFNDLSEANDSKETNIITSESIDPSILNMPANIYISALHGTQKVAKFNEESYNLVHVLLFNFRIPEKQTDILISINAPSFVSETSSSHINVTSSNSSPMPENWTHLFLDNSIKSFMVHNWNLFG